MSAVGDLTKEQIRSLVLERWKGTFNELVGFELLDAGEGFAKIALPLRPEVLQPMGIVHGGAVATLIDVASGVAVHLSYPLGTELVTVEMKVNFMRGAGEGVLTAESVQLHTGRRTAVHEVRVMDAAGRLAAIGTATYMVVKEAGPSAS